MCYDQKIHLPHNVEQRNWKKGKININVKEMNIDYVTDNIIFIYHYISPNVDSKDF